ncbi:helix-turn-helix domain-containing protein [Methylococcus mesophilus]|uniref:helix-turn-helix domain-containing protein n=1 Tax=Methylococcus mesophilus TaxID=2993564 RepID=UPI00224A675D|nr:helix-turn-helix domain-containing protein [Methylococcus mesophilus]UZR27245.1 helix-turn-helix domain-containing protein [Methylococcus mesophilus]
MNEKGKLVISSADLPEKERLDIWRESFSVKMVGAEIFHADPRPFFVQASFRFLGSVKLAWSTSTGARYRRTSKLVAADGNDDIGLPICFAGSWEVVQSRGRQILNRGNATLFNLGAAAEGGLASDSSQEHQQLLSVCLPREKLLRRVPRAERFLLRPLVGQEALRLLLDYLKMIEEKNLGQDPNLNQLIGEHILDIVGFLLGSQNKAEPNAGGMHAARRVALVRYLEENFREPNLSVDAIAASMKISRRYLYYLLDETGEGVTQMLNRLRLERARQLLADPRHGHLGIADIAFDSGFSDLSYFYRQFRSRFGETPGAFRRGAKILPCDHRGIPGPGQ